MQLALLAAAGPAFNVNVTYPNSHIKWVQCVRINLRPLSSCSGWLGTIQLSSAVVGCHARLLGVRSTEYSVQ